MREISEQNVAEYWNGNAPVWIDQVGKGFDVYREELNNPAIFEFIGDVRGKSVLDAGCGEGRNTRLLAKQGADVCGVDLAEAMIERAREEEVEAKLGIRYFKGSYWLRQDNTWRYCQVKRFGISVIPALLVW